ncbi:MAG: polymer-forming cytoskeletal protein [Deltaproteobacteria bacterium]|nr:polymer-forming cytoskeletal protein [Deltaproteobacteria bacterium]
MSAGEADGYVGPDLSFRGKLSGRGDVRIEGRFKGDVDIDGVLTVGAFAHVRAEIKAVSVSVAGKIVGNVRARTLVEVHAGGNIDGHVIAPKIMVDHGGRILGSSQPENFASEKSFETPLPVAPNVRKIKARFRVNK